MGTEQLEYLDVLGQLIVVERNGEAGHDVDVLEVGEFQRLDVTDRIGFYTLRQLTEQIQIILFRRPFSPAVFRREERSATGV